MSSTVIYSTNVLSKLYKVSFITKLVVHIFCVYVLVAILSDVQYICNKVRYS